MISPRITRAAYPMKRLRSGNAACSRSEMSRYASCSSVVAPSVTPTPRRASSRRAILCSSSYSTANSLSAASRSPWSAETTSVEIVESTAGVAPVRRLGRLLRPGPPSKGDVVFHGAFAVSLVRGMRQARELLSPATRLLGARGIIRRVDMTFGVFGRQVGYSVLGAVIVTGAASPALAQEHDHMAASISMDGKGKAGELVRIVREATERFKNVAVAENEGYGLQFGCVSGSEAGAMGMHFVNFPLVFDGELDATKPEIILYEPLPNGKLRLTGADYVVLADAWNSKHPEGPPQLN